jgi:hypothetical protein
MPRQPQKKKLPAWLKWLGISVGSIFLLIVVIALIVLWMIISLRNAWTVTQRVPLPEVIVTKEDVARLQPTYRKVKQAFSGKAPGETTIVLESDDLDKFLAVANEGRRLKELARFRIEDDKIVVTADVNLDRFPMCKGRYLSGDFFWDVKMDDQAWHFRLITFQMEDRFLPQWIVNEVNKRIASREEIVRTHYAPDWAQRLKSLTVQDGKITAVIK